MGSEEFSREADGNYRKGRREIKAQQIETIEKSPLKKFDDLEKIKEELVKRKPLKIEKIFGLMRNDEDLMEFYVAVFLHPVSRYGELELEDSEKSHFFGRHQQAYNKRNQLRKLELLDFINIHDTILKEARKEKLTKNEKIAMKKFKIYSKEMTEKYRLQQESRINYYVLSERGMDKALLNFVINLRNEE